MTGYTIFRSFLLVVVIAMVAQAASAQRFSLNHSRTMYDIFDNPYQSAYAQSRTSQFEEDQGGRVLIDLLYFNAPGVSMSGRFSKNVGSFIYGDQDLQLEPTINPEESFLYTNMRFHALGLSYRIEKETNTEIRFQNQLVLNGQFNVNDNFLVGFLDNGDPQFRGRELPGVLDIGGELTSYNKTTLGVRRDVDFYGTWNVGLQLHYYSGIYYAEAGLNNSFLFTQQDGESVRAYTEGLIRSSTTLDTLEDGSFDPLDALGNNNGFGVSLGLEYFIQPDFSVFFSAKDIGSINWNHTPQTVTIDSASIQWEGVNYEEEFEGFEVTNVDSFANANNGYFVADTSNEGFTAPVPTTLEIGAYKRWNQRLKTVFLVAKQFPEDPIRFNAIGHYQVIGGLHINSSLALSGDGLFSLGSYLFYNGRYFNAFLGSEQLSHLFIQQGNLGADFSMGLGLRF